MSQHPRAQTVITLHEHMQGGARLLTISEPHGALLYSRHIDADDATRLYSLAVDLCTAEVACRSAGDGHS